MDKEKTIVISIHGIAIEILGYEKDRSEKKEGPGIAQLYWDTRKAEVFVGYSQCGFD